MVGTQKIFIIKELNSVGKKNLGNLRSLRGLLSEKSLVSLLFPELLSLQLSPALLHWEDLSAALFPLPEALVSKVFPEFPASGLEQPEAFSSLLQAHW